MKVFLKILAAFMSVILAVLLIASPVLSFASNIISKDTIARLITSREMKDEIASGISFDDKETGKFTEKFLESECFDELFSKAADYIFAPLYGDNGVRFTEDDINRIIEKNLDEMTEIFMNTKDKAEELPREEVQNAVREIFSNAAPDIVKSINEVRDELDLSAAAAAVRIIKVCFYACIAAIIVFTCLIFLCTFRKFNGFIWLCADYGVAAILCVAVIKVLNFVLADIASGEKLLGIIVKIFTEKANSSFKISIIIYTVIAVICLATAITGKVLSAKKRKHTVPSADIAEENTVASQTPNYPQQETAGMPQ